MALVTCPECGRERVSNLAESCPSCGYGLRAHFEQEGAQTPQSSNQDFSIRGGVLLRYNGNEKNVTVPDTVIEIGEAAFQNCKNLESIKFPPSVTTIGGHAFFDCINLENIFFSDIITEIGESSFSGCAKLKTINLPRQLCIIHSEAFSGCESLNEVDLPYSIKTIGHHAFSGCTALKSLYIPESIKTIGYGAFSNCPSLADLSLTAKQFQEILKKSDSYVTLEKVFEECYDWYDDERWTDKNCGPWYLAVKTEEYEKRAQKEAWRRQNLCPHCGGKLSFFTNICKVCGKPPYYRS